VLKKGKVEYIDDMRIYIEGGDTLFFNADNVNYRAVDEAGNISNGSYDDFIVGRTLYYAIDGNQGNTVPLVVYAK